jgi:RNA polymerase sigma-70 factor (ECF subfamily)
MLKRCRDGDEAAWAAVVRDYERYVYAICVRGYGLGHADAQDVFQETFARTWTRLDRIADDAALRSWIGQVSRRLCIDRLRAAARMRPDPDVGSDLVDSRQTLEHIDRALDIHAALATLPEHYAEAIDRFFCRDQSYAQISIELGIPKGTIASRISRGLALLREPLADDLAAA